MNPEFRLEPPPISLQSPLLELQEYYAKLVDKYEKKAALAREQLARVEALVEEWAKPIAGAALSDIGVRSFKDSDDVLTMEPSLNRFQLKGSNNNGNNAIVKTEELPKTPEQTPPEAATEQEATQINSSLALRKPPSSIPGVPRKDLEAADGVSAIALSTESLTASNRDHTIARFVNSLHSSSRALINICFHQGTVKLIDLDNGIVGLSVISPNLSIHKRLRNRLSGYTEKFVQLVGNSCFVALSNLDDPIQAVQLLSIKDGWAMEKVLSIKSETYTILSIKSRNWLLILSLESPLHPLKYLGEDPNNSVKEEAEQVANSAHRDSADNSVTMLSPYQNLSRFEAIEKVLTYHKGTVLHIDFIVHELYGELKPEEFKVIKDRIKGALLRGKEKKRWSNVPDNRGCYTLDLRLVESKP